VLLGDVFRESGDRTAAADRWRQASEFYELLADPRAHEVGERLANLDAEN
jgi:hypothetical protein